MAWLDAFLGALFAEGSELEILGGLNFKGFTVTANEVINSQGETVSVYDIEIPAGVGGLASGIENDSDTVDGATVADALDALQAEIEAIDVEIGAPLDMNSQGATEVGALAGVTTLNGARVAAPTQGTAITTTATIDVSAGVKYDVSSAGGAYAITLGTSGTPVDGETITLRTTAALANAITVTNGGTGGGSLGPNSGTIPAGMHAEYSYYYDSATTAWKYGGRQRTQ